MTDIRDTKTAHVYRDGKIIQTVLIHQRTQPYWDYVAVLEEDEELIVGVGRTRRECEAIADAYIAGYMRGYDDGHEAGQSSDRDDRAEWASSKRRPTVRRLIYGDRKPAFKGERGSGAHESGTGEGDGAGGR